MEKQVAFYQLRQGDEFALEGEDYLKLWRYKTIDGELYNSRRVSDQTLRFVLDDQKVIPADSYWRDRISPITADVHEF